MITSILLIPFIGSLIILLLPANYDSKFIASILPSSLDMNSVIKLIALFTSTINFFLSLIL